MTLCMGILSALSTGFWGAVSDRMGRTLVMAVTLIGFATRLVLQSMILAPLTDTFGSDLQ